MQRKKVILFYNPQSGNGMFKNHLDYIIERYQDAGMRVIPIRAYGDAGLAEYLAGLDPATYQEEYAQILAAGGDGTLNVCVNAMIENGIDLPLVILPSGTANDFASYFNIPTDVERVIDLAMEQNYTRADVGIVNGRYFINVAAIGQVVDVSQKTDPTLKNSIGVLAYYLKGLSEVPDLKPIKVTLKTPEKVYKEKMYFMVVMNGRSAGGFRNLAPDSEINDGKLDVVLFRNMSLFEMPQVFMRILRGRHGSSQKVLHFKTSHLVLEAEDDLPTDIDGEHGAKLPLEFAVLPGRIRIAVRKEESQEEAADGQRDRKKLERFFLNDRR
ncbi:MAG: YegS/Rv2252/BmrU family lipid kinase [Firmicutes bacterium]|nr:YegS/Rv2252/BmrU family lipid kinase [Bacillota bacterium]